MYALGQCMILSMTMASLLASDVPSAPASCPYSAYRTTITRSFCVQPDAVLCIVDNACKELVSYSRRNVFKDPVSSTDTLVVPGPADFLAELPLLANTIFQFHNTNLKFVGDLANFSVNGGVQMDIVNNRGISFARARFPPSLSVLSIENNGLTDLPASIPYAYLTEFDASNNQLGSVANIDFRNAKALAFKGNPSLHSFSNVLVSSTLTSLDFGAAAITTFLVDEASFRALDALANFRVGSIDVSGTCRLPNVPRFLKRFTICVTPDPSNDTNGSKPAAPPNFGLIVALALGGGFLMGVAAWFVYTRRQRLKHAAETKSHLDSEGRPTNLTSNDLADAAAAFSYQETSSHRNVLQGSTVPYAAPFQMEDLALIRLDEVRLRKSHVVAQGAYGEVWYGEYKGDPVAVKCMLPGKHSKADVQCLIEEIKLTAKLESPYIVRTIGASWATPATLEMVVEWMDRGDLKQVLEKTKPSIPATQSTAFPWTDKVACMLAIAEGLVYLHSLDIIHRDLKSRNVLLDSDKGTKLTDFGASREANSETMTIGVGTYRWMAPEILKENCYTVAADIYSFGMVVTELDTHEIPYANKTNGKGKPLVDTAIMSMVIHGEIQPSLTATCPEWVQELARQCLAVDSDARPTAMQVAAIVRRNLKEMPAPAPIR